MAEDARILRVIEDWCDRRDRGELVSEDELIQSHPEIADELRAHLVALDALDGLEAAQAGLPDGTPREIGDYKIVREVGRGGMGVVYEAVQQSLGRRVALKVLSLTITGSPQAVKRFQRESKAAAKLHHTNIVPIYGAGQHAGHWYYAMELVEGRALDEIVKELRASRRTPTESKLARSAREMSASEAWSAATSGQQGYFVRVAEMFAGVADALHAAHTAKVLHRDVKPSNLMLDGDGTLKLVDFGLAHVDGADASMTATGDLLGTPAYMSPEQAMAKRVRLDARTDVYSLGATLYEVLTLRPPFRATDLPGLCAQILSKDPVAPRRLVPKLPKDLETIVMKAMEKDRDKRYANAGDFARDLRRFADGGTVQARRVNIAGRAWRKVKRRPVRSSLVTALLLAITVAVAFGVRAARDAERARQLEYDRLLLAGEGSVARSASFAAVPLSALPVASRAADHFTRAIALVPERPEAYALRALSSGRSQKERLEDVDRARRNGLDATTARLLVLSLRPWEPKKETSESTEPPTAPQGDLQLYLVARIAGRQRDLERALRYLDELLGKRTPSRLIASLGHRHRAALHFSAHRFSAALEDYLALRRLGDGTPLLLFSLARTWTQLGQKTKAADCLDEASAWASRQPTARGWNWLCELTGGARRTDWLRRFVKEGLAAHPNDALLHCWLSQAKVLPPIDYEAALKAAARALELRPDMAEAHYRRTWALCRSSRYEEARESCAQFKKFAPNDPRADGLMGLILTYQGKHEESVKAFKRALEASGEPPHLGILQNYGLPLQKLGRFEEALAAADRLVAHAPNWVIGHMRRGDSLSDLKRHAESVAAYELALKLDPDGASEFRANLFTALAQSLWNVGRHKEALTAADRAIELNPELGLAYYRRGWSRIALDPRDQASAERALADFDRALALGNPGNGRAQALLILSRPAEALASLRTEADLAKLRSQSLLGEALRLTGDYPGSIDAYTRAIELDSAKAYGGNFFICRSIGLGRLGRYAEALEDIDRAEHFRKDHFTYSNRGIYLHKLKRHEEALDVWAGWAAIAPKDVRPYHYSWEVLADLGRHAESLDAARKALAIDPTYVAARIQTMRGLLTLDRISEAVVAARDLESKLAASVWVRRTKDLEEDGQLDDAMRLQERGLEEFPGSHTMHGHVAWSLIVDDYWGTDLTARAKRAVKVAGVATRVDPECAGCKNTLGVALYYSGAWQESLEMLERAAEHQQADKNIAVDFYFIAMAKHRLGHEDSRAWFDKAVAWNEEHKPEDEELKRFRAEAAELLGVTLNK